MNFISLSFILYGYFIGKAVNLVVFSLNVQTSDALVADVNAQAPYFTMQTEWNRETTIISEM